MYPLGLRRSARFLDIYHTLISNLGLWKKSCVDCVHSTVPFRCLYFFFSPASFGERLSTKSAGEKTCKNVLVDPFFKPNLPLNRE